MDPPGTIHVVGNLAENFVAYALLSNVEASNLDFMMWDNVVATLKRVGNQTRTNQRTWAIVDLSNVNEEVSLWVSVGR